MEHQVELGPWTRYAGNVDSAVLAMWNLLYRLYGYSSLFGQTNNSEN